MHLPAAKGTTSWARVLEVAKQLKHARWIQDPSGDLHETKIYVLL